MPMKHAMLALALCLSGCAATGSRPMTASTVQETPTLAEFSRWVDERYVAPFVAGDVAKWLEVLDDDVVGLHNFLPPMTGKEALRGFGTFVRDNVTVAEMSVKLEGVRREGKLAYTWGRFHSRLLMKPAGEPMPGHGENGKVLFVWKQQADGSWKIAVDMGNAIRPATAR
jgi:ketosteroid isomerase-like protein